MKYPLFFDTETIRLPVDKMFKVANEDVPIGNLKDPDKIALKQFEFQVEWEQNGALRPESGQVAMVGFRKMEKDSTQILAGPESKILLMAWDTIRDHLNAGGQLVGFYCCDFDLPFMIRRSWANGIKPPMNLLRHRYWSDEIIDLWQVWCLGDRSPTKGTTTMAAVAKQLGLPPKLGSGEEFEQMDPNQREEYLRRDLEITRGIYSNIIC